MLRPALALLALATLTYSVGASANTTLKSNTSTQSIAPSAKAGGMVVGWSLLDTTGGAINLDIVGQGRHTCALLEVEPDGSNKVVASATSTTHCKLDYLVPSGSQRAFAWVVVNNDPTFYTLDITSVVWQ